LPAAAAASLRSRQTSQFSRFGGRLPWAPLGQFGREETTDMERIKNCAVAVVFLVVGAVAWAQEPRDESKPPQEPTKQEEARPEPSREAAPPARQNEARPPQQEESRPPKTERQESAKPPREESKPAHE